MWLYAFGCLFISSLVLSPVSNWRQMIFFVASFSIRRFFIVFFFFLEMTFKLNDDKCSFPSRQFQRSAEKRELQTGSELSRFSHRWSKFERFRGWRKDGADAPPQSSSIFVESTRRWFDFSWICLALIWRISKHDMFALHRPDCRYFHGKNKSFPHQHRKYFRESCLPPPPLLPSFVRARFVFNFALKKQIAKNHRHAIIRQSVISFLTPCLASRALGALWRKLMKNDFLSPSLSLYKLPKSFFFFHQHVVGHSGKMSWKRIITITTCREIYSKLVFMIIFRFSSMSSALCYVFWSTNASF